MESSFSVPYAERINQLPPYLFAAIDKKKAEVRAKGVDIIDLGVGDPDLPTPGHIVSAMQQAVLRKEHHRYPSYAGMPAFREAAAQWCRRRFNIALDPASEVLSLIGSKEGIAHMPLAYVNPGDYVLVPDPGYPVYAVATAFAGGIPYAMPLLEENNFLPDLQRIPAEVAEKAKLLFINYPNNPTGAIAGREFFEEVIAFARQYNIIVCHDAAYTEVAYDGYRPLSFLQIPGAMEVGIEFHSLSKTYNMTGWRIGFAAGNARAINGLGKVKTNIDSGAFQAVQEAAIIALSADQQCVAELSSLYRQRRDFMVDSLRKAGFTVASPKATFYLWIKNPSGMDSASVATMLLEQTGVVVTPGSGFGASGEGFFRISLTVPEERLQEAGDRIVKVIGQRG
ncbi:MAG: LL-diaminopimelate aminotransferase [Deltaproteobacteria bacterium]|nr:LL-diaminopimelate aminotransferase [Candidatus Anaeroferrophillus wilburensis]MBN2888324.1 LL-diaminopimelate aminotransferase [Deltaproteobacteria bacterium]